MTFFSPSLYLSVISSPCTPLTICATVALVMVLPGVRSHGRCPSPVPRSASGKIWISTAFWLPSACGLRGGCYETSLHRRAQALPSRPLVDVIASVDAGRSAAVDRDRGALDLPGRLRAQK